MPRPPRRPSHPLAGWAFVVFGCAGLVAGASLWILRCRAAQVEPWPLQGESLAALSGVVRAALPAALILVAGVLLPLQAWGSRPSRRAALSRGVTAVLLVVLGSYWIHRLNTVGFASLWSRRELLGEHIVPAALLENRVWSANIMLVFLVALFSLPLNRAVRALLDRPDLRRAPWPLWLLAGAGWVGLGVILLLAGRP